MLPFCCCAGTCRTQDLLQLLSAASTPAKKAAATPKKAAKTPVKTSAVRRAWPVPRLTALQVPDFVKNLSDGDLRKGLLKAGQTVR